MTRTERRRLAREKVLPAVTDLLMRAARADGYPVSVVYLPGIGELTMHINRESPR